MCALLHDNALTQYISEELKKDSVIDLKKDLQKKQRRKRLLLMTYL